MRNTVIDGKWVRLEEISPKYFADVVRWRNDAELNKYINQHFTLTEDMEREWYENVYLPDGTQGMFIVVDKETNIPFGTNGYTDYDAQKRICVWGRLMAGERRFQGSVQLIEGIMLILEYMFYTLNVEKIYSHPVEKNRASVRLNMRFGFSKNPDEPYFPNHLLAANDPMIELIATRGSFEQAKRKIQSYLRGLI